MISLRIMGSVVGFCVGCVALLAFYFIVQLLIDVFDVDHVRFRIPIIFFILPLISMFWGFELAPNIYYLAKEKYQLASTSMRIVYIGPFFWAAVVLAYILIFEPFGYRVDDSEWLFTEKIIIFPSAVLWIGSWVYIKFIMR